MTRLHPDARVIVLMTRWHEDDLVGRIVTQLVGQPGPAWHVIRLPAICEEDNAVEQRMGRQIGEALWPEQWPLEKLRQKPEYHDAYIWNALFQQRPAPLGGGLFKKKQFRYYHLHDGVLALRAGDALRHVALTDCLKFQTVDPAASVKTSADYTVISAWAVTPERDLVWLDCQRDKLEGPDQHKVIQQGYHRWKPSYIGVEKVGYQLTLVQALRRQGFPIKELVPDKDKVARAMVAAVLYEGGHVYHPAQAPWLAAAESELLLFPNDKHDDIVDTVSYAARQVVKPSR